MTKKGENKLWGKGERNADVKNSSSFLKMFSKAFLLKVVKSRYFEERAN